MSSLTAAALFAEAIERTKTTGDQECHWCAGPCDRTYIHNDSLPIPFVKNHNQPKRPSNAFMCRGCWLWHRRRQTILFLTSGFADIQAADNHSWWIVPDGAWGIQTDNPGDCAAVYRRLLQPPSVFTLSFRHGEKAPPNRIHLAVTNNNPIVQKDTVLFFTVNNTVFNYSIYELETALRNKDQTGREPGVQELLRILGPFDDLPPVPEVKKVAGRPPVLPDAKSLKKPTRPYVASSGR